MNGVDVEPDNRWRNPLWQIRLGLLVVMDAGAPFDLSLLKTSSNILCPVPDKKFSVPRIKFPAFVLGNFSVTPDNHVAILSNDW